MRSVRIVAQRVSVVMACRDYYATTRRWNSKWTAIGRLKYKVAMKRRVPRWSGMFYAIFQTLFSIHGFFLYEKTNETTASERNSSSMDLSHTNTKERMTILNSKILHLWIFSVQKNKR